VSAPSIERPCIEAAPASGRAPHLAGIVLVIAGTSMLGVSCRPGDADDRRAGESSEEGSAVAATPAPSTPVNERGLVLLLLRAIVNQDIKTADELMCWTDESPEIRADRLTRLLESGLWAPSADEVLTIRREFERIVLERKQDGDRVTLTIMWPWFGWSRTNTRTFVFRLDETMPYGGGLLSWNYRFSPHAPTFASPADAR
jgi:hypothetical protein